MTYIVLVGCMEDHDQVEEIEHVLLVGRICCQTLYNSHSLGTYPIRLSCGEHSDAE